MRLLLISAAVLLWLGGAIDARADTITLTGADREASLTEADEFDNDEYGTGNTTSTHLNGYFGGTWTIRGDTNSGNGLSDGSLTITFDDDGDALTDDDWGGHNVSGTWTITGGFWSTYADAVISIHVGGGGGDPDHFAFFITHGETTGTFSYDRLSGTGGGFSNIQLWSSGTAVVPEPATLAFVGLGVGCIAASRRRRNRS